MRFSPLPVLLPWIPVMASFPGNMHATHGYNYVYTAPDGEEVTYFPVAWDLRDTFFLLRDYRFHYHGEEEASATLWAETFLEGLFAEALHSGVNTLIIRGEPGRLDVRNTLLRVGQARAQGLHVILGGMVNGGGTLEDPGRNARVFSIWETCVSLRGEPQAGDLCGFFAHDEPDALDLDVYPELLSIRQGIHALPVSTGLPLGAALFAVGDPLLSPETLRDGTRPRVEGEDADPRSSPFLFGHVLDFISMNYYPCRISGELLPVEAYPEDNPERVVFRGAADLVPGRGVFRDAYCDRDEYCVLTEDGVLEVFELEGSDEPGEASFRGFGRIQLSVDPRAEGFRVTSSDTRSSDIGSRPGEPVLNGGMVFWAEEGPLYEARAVFWHQGGLVERPFPGEEGEVSRVLCLGETDYRSGWDESTPCVGVVGSADLRILWAGRNGEGTPWRVRVFGRDARGDLIPRPFPGGAHVVELPQGFHPQGAVWGYFWRTPGELPHFHSGFLLYTPSGDYVTVHTPAGEEEVWRAEGPFHHLWGPERVAGPVTVFRDNWNWPYTPLGRTHDRILALAEPKNGSGGLHLVWSSPGPGPGPILPPVEFLPVTVPDSLPPLSGVESLSGLSLFNMTQERRVRLFVNDPGPSDTQARWTDFFSLDSSGGPVSFSHSTFPNRWTVLAEMRSRHGRIPGPDVLMDRAPGLYLWAGRTDTLHPAVLLGNMYSPAEASGQDMGALDLMLEYGVRRTPAFCLFLTVQCHGRGCFGSGQVFPGNGIMGFDELVYLMGSALVHGIRGFNLYALDLALLGGPTRPEREYRFPREMLVWGASVDGPQDVDMVSRVHDAVAAFTRVPLPGGGTLNLLEALVNPAYRVLDDERAFCPGEDDPGLRFLALESPEGDLLVLLDRFGARAHGETVRIQETFPGQYADPEVLLGGGEARGRSEGSGYVLEPQGDAPFMLIRIPRGSPD